MKIKFKQVLFEVSLIALTGAISLVGAGCTKPSGSSAGNDSDSEPVATKQMAKEDDKQAEEILKQADITMEAREWLKKYPKSLFSDHTLKEDDDGKGTPMASVVNRLYEAGAQKVVIEYVKLGQADILAGVVVVLPTDKAARQKVFALDPELSELQQQTAAKEFGQKYLYYSLD